MTVQLFEPGLLDKSNPFTMFMEKKKKTAAILKFLVNWPLTWKYLNSNIEESFFQTLLMETYSTSMKIYWHPLLFGHSSNKVFKITSFEWFKVAIGTQYMQT